MATDTARVKLELASGRNESTAPFYQTAQRGRSQPEQAAASVGAPASVQTFVDVPLAHSTPVAASADPELVNRRRGGGTPWIAFVLALISVGVAVWWVMAQRMPDIDPRDVIARNLDDAQAAMASGRYMDPPERSAFHYYSTVLALDPSNADAIAGIDDIAERHLADARVLLSRKRLAEAGVALEKVRRVRPDHNGLAVLDTQWRAELRRILAAATAKSTPAPEPPVKSPVTKNRDVSTSLRPTRAPTSEQAAAARPEIKTVPASPPPKVADVDSIAAVLAASQTPRPAVAAPPPEPPPIVSTPIPSRAAVPAGEPKLVRMVQPQYPQEALMRGIEGWVEVSLQVSASGDVVAPRIEQTSRGRMFNRAALAAVEQWKYEPRSDGTTSERVHVRLKFQQSN